MTPKNLSAIHRYLAVTSVGPSTVRGSPQGTADAARNFLSALRLKQFGTSDRSRFSSALDRQTEVLRRSLPATRRHWGLARKVLNIFLHNAFYNYYLRRANFLGKAERLFELPIDSAVVRGLRRATTDAVLPTWQGLSRLTISENEEFQVCALQVARQMRISRVHLDAILWTQER